MTPEKTLKWTNICTALFCTISVINRLIIGEFITNGLIFTPLVPFCVYGIAESVKDWKKFNKGL